MNEIPQFRIDVSELDLPDILTQAKFEVFQERRRAAIEKEKSPSSCSQMVAPFCTRNHNHMENQMSLINIADVKAEAAKEINNERMKKAKDALVKKLRELAAAEDVVRNIKRSVEDLEQSIIDGSFTG